MKVIENAELLAPEPVISILCITFNQIDYIAGALDSFLAQDVDVPIEVLVNDDCSTDCTTEVLLDYQRRHPDLFRIVTHEENQYSRGVSPMGQFLVPLARGRFIAMCEGDDYWTDPTKLRLQLHVMSERPEIAACVHANENVQAATKRRISTVRYAEGDCMIALADIVSRSQCYATNSLFVRAEAMRAYHGSAFFPLPADGDHKMLVHFGLIDGGIYYIDRVMSAYRVLSKNSVNRTMLLGPNTAKVAKRKHDNRVELLELADRETGGVYHDDIERGIDCIHYAYYRDIRDLKTLRARWPERLEMEGPLARIDLFLYTYARPLHKLALNVYCRL